MSKLSPGVEYLISQVGNPKEKTINLTDLKGDPMGNFSHRNRYRGEKHLNLTDLLPAVEIDESGVRVIQLNGQQVKVINRPRKGGR